MQRFILEKLTASKILRKNPAIGKRGNLSLKN